MKTLEIQLIRNATLLVNIDGKKILIDAMLGEVGSIKTVPLTRNKKRNPIVPLTVSLQKITDIDAILITHRHFDHFDEEAKKILPKNIPLFCQPQDEIRIRKSGFNNVTSIDNFHKWEGIKIYRVNGNHGTGLAGLLMGKVSGFVFEDRKGKKLYIAGDTVYNKVVEKVLEYYQPDVTVVNSGEAQLIFGNPITMTKEDVLKVANISNSIVVAVHLEAVNHCSLKRIDLNNYINKKGLYKNVIIPNDGEIMSFT
ncbi:MBL fold metallo-hydrolase [Ectobacillus polymachus]|uniref:MBL fold metallo-hydrolase n=1 Tax=Ectobacillus polymachus TaxID=1508806 RepID=UPI003A83D49F